MKTIDVIVQAMACHDLDEMFKRSAEATHQLIVDGVLVEDDDGIVSVDTMAVNRLLVMCNSSEEDTIVRAFIAGVVSLWGYIDDFELMRETH